MYECQFCMYISMHVCMYKHTLSLYDYTCKCMLRVSAEYQLEVKKKEEAAARRKQKLIDREYDALERESRIKG